MAITNRLAPNEKKIAFLLGEKSALIPAIEKAEAQVAKLPQMRERLWEITTLINAAKALIRDDHPDWTIEHIEPQHKWVHKNPIKIGQLTRGALSILREAAAPVTCREVALMLLRQQGCDSPTSDDEDMVANAVQVAFHKRRGTAIESDGEWPEHWWAIKPE